MAGSTVEHLLITFFLYQSVSKEYVSNTKNDDKWGL